MEEILSVAGLIFFVVAVMIVWIRADMKRTSCKNHDEYLRSTREYERTASKFNHE